MDVLECALAMMIEDEQHECAVLFLQRHPTLLGYVRTCTDPASAFTDYPPLKARFPRLVFHLQARRARARALSNLDGQAMDEQVKALEERLAQIRREVACHAIGAPYR